MTEEQPVLVDVTDGVMTITLNRPKAKNAVNLAVATAVAAALEELDSNDDIRVAILTGAGGSFCAGMDLKAFVTGEMPVIPGRGFGGLAECSPKKPLIAAVEGYALAGGLELMISCDLIVAAEDAQFGITEVKRGLVAGAGGLMKLPRQIPPRLAMEMALTGEFSSAQRAMDMGLINRVVPSGTALDTARELAVQIGANGPLAVRVSKQVMMEQEDWSTDEMWAKQQELVNPVFVSADAIEGATAFAEKRAPNWTGK
ncbi:crotonase/enoyl-CoA hydratase family protein [Halieaceae bacterium IMCC8485]|jgi:enoyl-CoA hydratase|uniref:Crotonase/enoyl-CoA hydratase family protein n=1 Tax=Candidatus Seongchinamella marina TaxID=2518990 RepID=A0ABT3SX44_9GAMM|nr:crotonase/enoyl-CoA hydratase family protein [Candidatus Seongchinamella marina]MCX2974490.1 crotonase/enoyl-CoA hydratase family protein [Candidatus Seongchinamella marina]